MYGCNLLTATSIVDPKELTNPFWYGMEKREGVRVRVRMRERKRENRRREKPQAL